MIGVLQINLCSGGMDSYLAWKLFTPDATNVYVRLGHRYEQQEVGALARLMANDHAFRVTAVTGPMIGNLETPSGIIPCRNLLLLATAAAHAGGMPDARTVVLYLGALAGEINSDKSAEFCLAAQRVLDISWRPQYWTTGVQFIVDSAVREYTKAQLITEYVKQGYDLALLGATRSCYSGDVDRDADRRHCARCTACFKRWVAFRAAGVPDPTAYAANPRDWPGAALALDAAYHGTYDAQRAAETLLAMHRGAP